MSIINNDIINLRREIISCISSICISHGKSKFDNTNKRMCDDSTPKLERLFKEKANEVLYMSNNTLMTVKTNPIKHSKLYFSYITDNLLYPNYYNGCDVVDYDTATIYYLTYVEYVYSRFKRQIIDLFDWCNRVFSYTYKNISQQCLICNEYLNKFTETYDIVSQIAKYMTACKQLTVSLSTPYYYPVNKYDTTDYLNTVYVHTTKKEK